MKKLIFLIAFLISLSSFGQVVKMQVQGAKQVTTTQRDALTVPAGEFWQIYNITTARWEFWDGDSWEALDTTGGSPAWGDLTGDINNQTDLIDLLNQYSSYQGTQILEVNYYWVSSYTYHVNTVVWLEDGILNTNNFNQDVVLDTADPTNPRVDRVVLNITSDTVYDLTGTPASNPAPPELAGDELELFFVNVPINGPPNVVNDLVYDENLQEVGGEWDTTVSGSVVTNASTEPSNGTLHTAWTTAATNTYVEYSLASPITATDGFLIFKFKQPSVHNFRFGIRVNDGTFSYPLATIENGIFGADNTITTYQTIVIPFEVDNVQSIRFINTRNNSTIYFDEIYVQTGVEIPVDPLSLYLNNLADVDVTGATDGQGITYDSATQNWVNTTLSTDDQTAAEVPVTDVGDYFTGTDVEAILQEIGAGAGGGGGTFEYQTEITGATTVFDGTQKGLNKVYVFNSASPQTVQIDNADYLLNDVINIERRGQGTLEIVQGANVRFKGVRDIDNRFFVNDPNSIVALYARGDVSGEDQFTIIGNLKRGYTGPVTTLSYSNLEPIETVDVNVSGTGFSANMKDPVVVGNATLNSWAYVNNNNITLNMTSSGIDGDFIDITYDNGDVFFDDNAITLSNPPVTGLVFHTTSTSATWSPSGVTKSGAVLKWTVTGGASGVYDVNDPTIDLSSNSGTAIITVTSTDGFSGLTMLRMTSLSVTYADVSLATGLTEFWLNVNPSLTDIVGIENLSALNHIRINNNALTGTYDLTNHNITNTLAQLQGNQFTGVVIGTGVKQLDINTNLLTSIDLSSSPQLTYLYVYGNNFSSGGIDISNLTLLTTLHVGSTQITSLDISANTALATLYCTSNTGLNTLDIGTNTALKIITISGCSLDVSTINNVILDRYNNGVLSGTRTMNYAAQSPAANPTATETVANDVLDAYNALVAAGWTITGAVPTD